MRLSHSVLALAALAAAPAPASAAALPGTAAEVVARVMPSVVSITIVPAAGPAQGDQASGKVQGPSKTKQPDADSPAKRMIGSGFIIDADGLIVTNKHVVDKSRRILVTLSDRTVLRATVVGMAAKADVALIRVSAHRPLPVASFGDSGAIQVGEPVLAIGNPLGRGESVTAGIVSALNRDIRSSPFDDFIQTDAAINHGNSGGPLFDMAGQVIGMNTALDSPTPDGGSIGIGFAMPSSDVRFVVDSIRQYGHVRAGWIGARMQPMMWLVAKALGLPDTRGALVAEVMPDTPAAKAGLVQGDVVCGFDGQDVPDVRALMRMAARTAPGKTVTLSVWRDGALHPMGLTLAEFPGEAVGPEMVAPPAPDASVTPDFGLHLVAATPALRKRYKLPPTDTGPVVARIESDGEAGDTSIATGDMIVKVQNEAVTSAADVFRVLRDAQAKGAPAAVVLVLRGGAFRWIGMPMGDAR